MYRYPAFTMYTEVSSCPFRFFLVVFEVGAVSTLAIGTITILANLLCFLMWIPCCYKRHCLFRNGNDLRMLLLFLLFSLSTSSLWSFTVGRAYTGCTVFQLVFATENQAWTTRNHSHNYEDSVLSHNNIISTITLFALEHVLSPLS